MDLQLSGQVAIVTGSSRGIGASIAMALAREGAPVVINYVRDRMGAESVCEAIQGRGGSATICQADVADPLAAMELVQHAVAQFGRIDILVNNAGINVRKSFLETSRDEFELVVRTNLGGTWNCSQAAAVHMVQARYGRILNCSSDSAFIPAADRAAYAASKAAIIALTKAMPGELAPYNVLVNAYVPGAIDTEMARSADGQRGAEMVDSIGLRRFGRSDEIGVLVAFLASPINSYMSGSVVGANGAKLAVQNPTQPWRKAGSPQ